MQIWADNPDSPPVSVVAVQITKTRAYRQIISCFRPARPAVTLNRVSNRAESITSSPSFGRKEVRGDSRQDDKRWKNNNNNNNNNSNEMITFATVCFRLCCRGWKMWVCWRKRRPATTRVRRPFSLRCYPALLSVFLAKVRPGRRLLRRLLLRNPSHGLLHPPCCSPDGVHPKHTHTHTKQINQ